MRPSASTCRDPQTEDDRRAVAQSCAVALSVRLLVAVDGPDDAVARAYGGWPDRLYLVGRDGRIAYRGGEGPFGFKPEELERAIERELRYTSTVAVRRPA